jgi:hypothetical protein
MEAERDVVRRIRTPQFPEGRGVQDQQERRGLSGVQHRSRHVETVRVAPVIKATRSIAVETGCSAVETGCSALRLARTLDRALSAIPPEALVQSFNDASEAANRQKPRRDFQQEQNQRKLQGDPNRLDDAPVAGHVRFDP